jgi:hypothetical protein
VRGISGLRELDEGVEMELKSGKRTVCANISQFTADMPQCNSNLMGVPRCSGLKIIRVAVRVFTPMNWHKYML